MESRNYVRSVLPRSWIVEDVHLDYGTDLRVEIVSEGEPTGRFFFVQVKAHESVVNDDSVLQDLDVGHVRYYLRHPVPVFLAVYDRSTKRAFFQDVRTYVDEILSIEVPGWGLQKTVRFRISVVNRLETGQSAIEKVVRDNYEKHGLSAARPAVDPYGKLASMVLVGLAEAFPNRKLYPKTVRDARKSLRLTKRTRVDESRLQEMLGNFVLAEDSDEGMCLRLRVPDIKILAQVAALIPDDDLPTIVTSPWAVAVKEPYFLAFLVFNRLRRGGKLLATTPTVLRRNLEVYFALLEELLVLEPQTLEKIPNIFVESVIRSTGDQLPRSTSFRFTVASLNSAYEEFIAKRNQAEWTEIVTTSSHVALVRLRVGMLGKESRVRARVLESTIQDAKFAFEVVESVRDRNERISLVDIPVIQRRVAGQIPLVSVYSEVGNFHLRGGLLESFQIAGGQQVSLRPIVDPAGYGARLFVDGVLVIESWMGADLRAMSLPPEILEAARTRRTDSKLRLMVVILHKLERLVEMSDKVVIGEIVTRLKERHPNLVSNLSEAGQS